jgi:hypothetical protein
MQKRGEKQKRKSKIEDKRRSKRFKENARKVSSEENPAEFDRGLVKMLLMDKLQRAV